jgi:hypothetical protein
MNLFVSDYEEKFEDVEEKALKNYYKIPKIDH